MLVFNFLTLVFWVAVTRLHRSISILIAPKKLASKVNTKHAKELRSSLKRLPSVDTNAASASQRNWNANRMKLRELLLTQDPNTFLQWDVTKNSLYYESNLIELFTLWKENWSFWKKIVPEKNVGSGPYFALIPSTTGNSIHLSHHLHEFSKLGGLPSEYDQIVEVGGGFGSMCRLCFKTGFTGKYIIFDLPEINLLQEYYLKENSVPLKNITLSSTITEFSKAIDPKKKTLFIATWSFSEMPLALREGLLKKLTFDAVLIGYQNNFEEVNNSSYFKSFKKKYKNFKWQTEELFFLPNNHYLFGVKSK